MNNEKHSSRGHCHDNGIVFRTPRRISVTLAFGAYKKLLQRSDQEGRSLSNLAAFLLETSLQAGVDGQRSDHAC